MFPAEEGFPHQEDRRIRYSIGWSILIDCQAHRRREVQRNDLIPGIVQRISRTPLTGWMVYLVLTTLDAVPWCECHIFTHGDLGAIVRDTYAQYL